MIGTLTDYGNLQVYSVRNAVNSEIKFVLQTVPFNLSRNRFL